MKTEKGYEVFMYIDDKGHPTQTHYKASIECYRSALRSMLECCIEDYGEDEGGAAVAYAVFRNNLPPDLWDYCE